jgi:prevent-host-death family protein
MTMSGKIMAQFNIADAKARFSELVDRALAGDEVIVARDNKPLLKLVPLAETDRRRPGTAKGQIEMAPDFDAPLPDFDDYQ